MKLIATIDPSHGWLRVPMHVLEQLNIVDKITAYSYKCAGYAFLEEDFDWETFVQAANKNGLQYSIKCKILNKDSIIREYDRFTSENN